MGTATARAARLTEPAWLLAGLGAALAVRVGLAPRNPAASPLAGVVFALILLVLTAAAGVRPSRPRASAVLAGAAGAAVIVAGPLLALATGARVLATPGTDSLATWALVVVLLSAAEEGLLRGALFAAVQRQAGGGVAVMVTAGAFALIHVPLYGWGAVPLDLAVGVWLGGLRQVTGSVAAPLTAHALADLCGWWLR